MAGVGLGATMAPSPLLPRLGNSLMSRSEGVLSPSKSKAARPPRPKVPMPGMSRGYLCPTPSDRDRLDGKPGDSCCKLEPIEESGGAVGVRRVAPWGDWWLMLLPETHRAPRQQVSSAQPSSSIVLLLLPLHKYFS